MRSPELLPVSERILPVKLKTLLLQMAVGLKVEIAFTPRAKEGGWRGHGGGKARQGGGKMEAKAGGAKQQQQQRPEES